MGGSSTAPAFPTRTDGHPGTPGPESVGSQAGGSTLPLPAMADGNPNRSETPANASAPHVRLLPILFTAIPSLLRQPQLVIGYGNRASPALGGRRSSRC